MDASDRIGLWTADLHKEGHRLTAPRRAVIRVLAETPTSLTPDQILRRARRYYPKTGLVTVYRALEVLAGCGHVRKMHRVDGCHSYAPASAGHAHHIVCDRCRAVMEFPGCNLDALIKSVQRRTGYAVRGHWLELSGLCPRCRKTE
ncbi:MAG: transcriptional repressor [Anaerolineales bacterium]|nr:transcriptional repressor [Anaerolineales bacterium]